MSSHCFRSAALFGHPVQAGKDGVLENDGLQDPVGRPPPWWKESPCLWKKADGNRLQAIRDPKGQGRHLATEPTLAPEPLPSCLDAGWILPGHILSPGTCLAALLWPAGFLIRCHEAVVHSLHEVRTSALTQGTALLHVIVVSAWPGLLMSVEPTAPLLNQQPLAAAATAAGRARSGRHLPRDLPGGSRWRRAGESPVGLTVLAAVGLFLTRFDITSRLLWPSPRLVPDSTLPCSSKTVTMRPRAKGESPFMNNNAAPVHAPERTTC